MILPIRSSYSKRIYLLLKELCKNRLQRVSNIWITRHIKSPSKS